MLLFGGEQVEEERPEPGLLDHVSDLLVARAVAAAAAAMREEDERGSAVGEGERAAQAWPARDDLAPDGRSAAPLKLHYVSPKLAREAARHEKEFSEIFGRGR